MTQGGTEGSVVGGLGNALHRQCLEQALAAVQGLQPLLIDSAQAGQAAGDAVPRLQAVMLSCAAMCSHPAAATSSPAALAPASG